MDGSEGAFIQATRIVVPRQPAAAYWHLCCWILLRFRRPLGEAVNMLIRVFRYAQCCAQIHQTPGGRIESVNKGGQSCELALMS